MRTASLPIVLSQRSGRVGLCCLQAGLLVLAGSRAFAWDAATTHAGLTQRALASSKFHAALVHQMGRALGGFEPLKLDARVMDADTLRSLKSRLDLLDSAGGYRPTSDGVATAVGWVEAGAVLAKTPPELGRHHFFEPGKRTGLDDGPGLSGSLHAARLTMGDGAGVRDAATGSAFDLEGMPATAWLWAPQNDLGLAVFFDSWALAVSAKQPGERETALVRALLALGGVLSVLEDMGQPAYVRNDFRGEFTDAGSGLETFVADRYGSVALPKAAPSISRPDLLSFFVAADGKGLAQMTQRRFFSQGTLPRDFTCVPGDTSREAALLVNRSLRFAEPHLDSLDLGLSDRTRYLVQEGTRIAAYRRVGDKIHFFFDQAVYADTARRWLPEVMGYAAGLADHLLRAELQISVAGDQATLTMSGISGVLEHDTVAHVFAEDERGERQEISAVPLQGTTPASVRLPKGIHKVAAFARGRDSAGAFVASGESALP
jgi:hypothetical protein